MKLRGFRIEPGEIEAALLRHPAWRRRRWWRARTQPATSGWWPTWCPRGDAGADAAALRAHLAASLPDYMVPSAFVRAGARCRSPPTASSTAAPCRRRSVPTSCGRSRAPRDAAGGDRCAACSPRCWALERVGIDDNFFELGGHSLLATRLISRVRAALASSCRCAACSRRRPWRAWPQRLDAGAARRAPLAARRRVRAEVAAVVRAAAAVVPRPAGRAQRHLQHPVALRLHGRARRRGAGAGARRPVARHETLRTLFPDTTACRGQADPGRRHRGASAADGRVPVTEASRPRRCASAARRGPSTWRPSRRCGRSCSRSATRARAAARCCTTSPAMAGPRRRSARPCRAYAARAATAGRRTCRRCRCSTPTTRCGSARCWARRATRSTIARQLAFWTRARWPALPDQLDLPTDRPRPAVPSYRGDSVPLSLPARAARGSAGAGRARGGDACSWCCRPRSRRCSRGSAAGTDIPIGTPDRRPHRQRARRSDRLLRQHAGAAHRPVRRPELPRPARAGARRPISPPTATRTCRSSGWSRCSTRRARWPAIRCSR